MQSTKRYDISITTSMCLTCARFVLKRRGNNQRILRKYRQKTFIPNSQELDAKSDFRIKKNQSSGLFVPIHV